VVKQAGCRSANWGYLFEKPKTNVIEETIKQIEARIQSADSFTPERRKELVELLATLKAEAGELAKTHGEQAQNIVGFAQVTAHEATRAEQDPQQLDLSLKALRSSVQEFEESHPRLANIVNTISTTLSNSGI
jgi:cell division septum initiation protein DivIVA